MEWIKVGDKKPPHGKDLLLYHEYEVGCGFALGYYDEELNLFVEYGASLSVHVTHWCRILFPPREDDGV